MKNAIIKLLATGLGLGLLPFSPETWGTLLGVPIAYTLHYRGPLSYLLFTLMFVVFSVWIAEMADPLFKEHDSPKIVIDEVGGFLVTMAWLPATWQAFVLGFIIFRFLDTLKPGPMGYLNYKIKGGLGIVVDDIAAGIVANVILQVLYNYTDFLGARLL